MSGDSWWNSLSSGFSSFADGVSDFFTVESTVSPSANMKADDVFKTKSALNALGNYEVPDFGMTEIPDTNMIDGLKSFQADNGLKVDGVMKPGGPTENALGQTLANQGISTTDLLEKAKKPTIEPVVEAPKVKAPPSPTQTSLTTATPLAQASKPKKPKLPKIDPMTGLVDPLASAPKGKMPTKKQWEEVAELQKKKASSAIIPQGGSVNQRIRSMMTDKRYGDKKDTRLRDHVVKQFEKAYPGDVEYDETGKMIQPQAVIQPDQVEPFDPDGELQLVQPVRLKQNTALVGEDDVAVVPVTQGASQTTGLRPIFYFDKNGKPNYVFEKNDGSVVDENGEIVEGVQDWISKRDDKTGHIQVANSGHILSDGQQVTDTRGAEK